MATGNHFWLDIAAGRRSSARSSPRRSCYRGRCAGALRAPGAVACARERSKAGVHRRRDGAIASRSMSGLARTRVTPNDAHRRRRHALRRRRRARLLRVPERAGSSSGRRRSLFVVGSVLDILDGALARAGGKRRRSARSSTRHSTASARGSCSARSRSSSCATGSELALASRSRRSPARSSSVHARQSRGARAQGRRRHRLARRARRRDLGRARARAVGRAAVGDRPARADRLDHGRCSASCTSAASSQHAALAICARVLALWLLALLHASGRASSSGCPARLKRALVREVARRESNLNDVAVGLLAERFGDSLRPERPPPQGDPRRGRRRRCCACRRSSRTRAQGRGAAPQAQRQRPRPR